MKTSSLYLESLLAKRSRRSFAEIGEHPKASTADLAKRAAVAAMHLQQMASRRESAPDVWPIGRRRKKSGREFGDLVKLDGVVGGPR